MFIIFSFCIIQKDIQKETYSGKREKAQKILENAARVNKVKEIEIELTEEINQKSSKSKWLILKELKQLFQSWKLLRKTLI